MIHDIAQWWLRPSPSSTAARTFLQTSIMIGSLIVTEAKECCTEVTVPIAIHEGGQAAFVATCKHNGWPHETVCLLLMLAGLLVSSILTVADLNSREDSSAGTESRVSDCARRENDVAC